MLVLTRKTTEGIRIGDDITITVVRVQRGRVKLALSAPAQVPIHREEVHRRVMAETVDARAAS